MKTKTKSGLRKKTTSKKKTSASAKNASVRTKKTASKKASASSKKRTSKDCKVSLQVSTFGRATQRGSSAGASGLSKYGKKEKAARLAKGCLTGVPKKKVKPKQTIVGKISAHAKKTRKVGEAWPRAIKRATTELKRMRAI